MTGSTIGAAISAIFATLLGLGFVLGLAWLLLRLLKRWQDKQSFGGSESPNVNRMRFVRALAVGQRERIVLIEVRGELMLIGVGQASVTLLHNWGAVAAPKSASETADDGHSDDGNGDDGGETFSIARRIGALASLGRTVP
jgi:flagellar protein FliO/FliZ